MHFQFARSTRAADYLDAIAGRDEFAVRRDPASGLMILNYVFQTPDTFADPALADGPDEYRRRVLRRECRGLTFDLESGELIARKFHKFFNVNERPETAQNVIDWSQRHWILEKLDGSMITGRLRRDDRLEWHTKMGLTEVAAPVNEFVQRSPLRYEDFFRWAHVERGMTPIFEWCSRQQRIVVDYPTERLVLTAMRDRETGAYVPYPKMVGYAERFGLPVVSALESGVDDVPSFLASAADVEGAEGYVIRFESGHMLKVKGAWYRAIHGAIDQCTLEKNVWTLVLDDLIDDVKPQMAPDLVRALDDFTSAFYDGLTATVANVTRIVEAARRAYGADKKSFAAEMSTSPISHPEKALAFRIWDGFDGVEALKDLLRRSTGSQTKVEAMRYLVGDAQWRRFYLAPSLDGD